MEQRNYLTHQLNKSPTKFTYTFSRTPRFPDSSKDAKKSRQNSLARSKASSAASKKSSKSRGKGKGSGSVSSSRASQNTLKAQNNKQITCSQSISRNQKQISSKTLAIHEKEPPNDIISIQKYYNKCLIDNDQQNLLEDSIITKKTYTTIKSSNTEISARRHANNRIHPINCAKSKAQEISSKKLENATSNRKSPIVYTFTKSPKNQRNNKRSVKNLQVGPGTYNKFSQFGI